MIMLFLSFMLLFFAEVQSDSLQTNDCNIKIDAKVKHSTGGNDNGQIDLKITGAKEPFKVFWIPGDESTSDQKKTALAAGFYTITVVDANKCIKTIENIEVKKSR